MPHTYPDGKYPQLTNTSLPTRARHLAMGMLVIAGQANVDSVISVLLTKLAKGSPAAVAAIYGVLRQGHLQSKAVLAVAQEVLTGEDVDVLKRILKVAKEASDLRDVLAHRQWFVDERLDDAVVLVDPALHWRTGTALEKQGGPGPTTPTNAQAVMDQMKAACEIWSMRDLERARHLVLTTSILIGMFSALATATDEATRKAELDKIEKTFALLQKNPGQYSKDLRWDDPQPKPKA